MKLFYKWLVCFGALFMAQLIFPGYVQANGFISLVIASAVWLLLNLIVKPLLQLVCLPLTLLTLGLFFLVVNAWMVGLMDAILPIVRIPGFWIHLFVALPVALGNFVIMAARRVRA